MTAAISKSGKSGQKNPNVAQDGFMPQLGKPVLSVWVVHYFVFNELLLFGAMAGDRPSYLLAEIDIHEPNLLLGCFI